MSRLLDKVIRVLGVFLRILLIITVALIGFQIFSRYLLGKPTTWSEQLCRFMFIWMTMLAIPVLFYNKSFMAFDLILNKLPGKAKDVMVLIIDIVICIFACFWLYGVIGLCAGTMKKLTSGVRIHYYWLYGAQGVSALLIIWVMLTQTFQQIRHLAGKGTASGKGEGDE